MSGVERMVDCINPEAPAGTFCEFVITGASPCVTHIGIFSRRPLWQRVIGLVYRPWSFDKYIRGSAIYEGKLATPLNCEKGQKIRSTLTFS